MSTPESLVEMIFTKCALVYGRDFLSRWEGLDLAEVKADWRRELKSLLDKPPAILYGLEHLPEKPPNVLTFRAICVARPVRAERDAPMTDAQRIAANKARALAVSSLKLIGAKK